MAEVASAYVSLLPSTRGFGSKMSSDLKGEVGKSGTSLGRTFGKLFAVAGGALAAIGIGGFLKDSIAEAREAQKVTAITEQIIKSTGGAAKVTAKQVADLATAISLKTGVDDEAIQSGANLLLTFKNIRNEVGQGNDVFNQATQAAIDLSAAGFGSMESASKMLGKALNDPLKGLTALGRAGVTFSEQQSDRIKGLIAEGKVLQAQKLILAEVQSQVGGVAEASATAGEKAAVAWANLKEQLGTALLPVIDRVAAIFTTQIVPAISAFIVQVQTGTGLGGQFRDVFTQVAAVLMSVGGFIVENAVALGVFVGALTAVKVAVEAWKAAQLLLNIALTANPIGVVIVAIAALVAGLIYAYKHSEAFRNIVDSVGRFLAETFKPTLDQLAETFRNDILPVLKQIIARFQEWWPTIQTVIGFVAKLYAKWVEFQLMILGKVLPVVIRFVGFLVSTMVPAIGRLISATQESVEKVIAFGKAVIARVKDVAQFVAKLLELGKTFGEKLLAPMRAVASFLAGGLKTAIGGIISGIQSLIGFLGDAIGLFKELLNLQGTKTGAPNGTAVPSDTSPRGIAPSAPIPGVGELAGVSNGSVVAELRALRAEMARNTAAALAGPDRFARGLNGVASDARVRSFA